MFGNFSPILLFSGEGLKKIPMFHLFKIFSQEILKPCLDFFRVLTKPWFWVFWQYFAIFWRKFNRKNENRSFPGNVVAKIRTVENKISSSFPFRLERGTFPCSPPPCWHLLNVIVDSYYSIISIASTVLMDELFSCFYNWLNGGSFAIRFLAHSLITNNMQHGAVQYTTAWA